MSVLTLTKVLSQQLEIFKVYGWYKFIISHFYQCIGQFIDKEIMHAITSKREYCTLSNALNMKMKLYTIQEWYEKYRSITGEISFDLTIEASTILSVDKHTLVEESFRNEVAPHLTTAQILKLLQMFSPDDFCPDPTPQEIIDEIELQITEKDAVINPKIKIQPEQWLGLNESEQLNWTNPAPPTEKK